MEVNQLDILLNESLRLVIRQDKDVIKKLRKIEKIIGVKLYTIPLRFRVPACRPLGRPSSIFCFEEEPLCDCWFEHEYLDYMLNGQCNKEIFSRICLNLENGQCEHVREGRTAAAYIYLIHAAVATNNKKVTKYISRQIMKRSNVSLNDLTTGVESLTAAHTAVLKGSGDALQYVIGLYAAKESTEYPSCFYGWRSFRNHSITKRNDITGNVETFELKGCHVLTYLLAHCKSPSQMKILFQFLPSLSQHELEDLMNKYLSTGNEEFARIVLSDRRTSNMCLDSTILLNAVFLHAHDFVYSWIRQKQSMSVEVNGVTIHHLFIAEALGCQVCISLMRRSMQKHHTTQNEFNTCEDDDVSPFTVACYIADKFNYDSDILINILKTLNFTVSCNLHKRNSTFETVLHELVKSKFFKKVALECLLEFGCDVNASDGKGRTPLHVLLKSSKYSVDAVKCLLEHGADVNKSDFKGHTPFMEILEQVKQKYSRHGCFFLFDFDQIDNRSVECLKFILYFNPSVDIHSDVLFKAKTVRCYDFKGYINLPLVPSDESASLFAILMEMGFMNYQPDEHDVSFGSRFRFFRILGNTGTVCNDYYQQFISQPRSLQSICRVGIRQAFPGYQLHKLFQQYQIPKRLREYILFEDILFFKETLALEVDPQARSTCDHLMLQLAFSSY